MVVVVVSKCTGDGGSDGGCGDAPGEVVVMVVVLGMGLLW